MRSRESQPLRTARRWALPDSGPTATVSQRARRRQRQHAGLARALVYARRPPGGALASALDGAGLEVEWTDSGPAAIAEALERNLAVCLVVVRGGDDEGLGYLPCLNQANPCLPVVVVSERDSLETQRRLRSHRVFYYLVGSPDIGELGAVLAAALAGRAGA